ncbi:nuclear GTP-binding protein Nug1p [[Candida] anglica]|uniref:Nuclear GTP-binding protein Nug1p n=1 Tax=[Candida] anglica TaxID=148631 RepID=A0ABP0ELU8_9ASCO
MRVKKPTSKRSTTRLREGIKKKAAAQNRKNRKFAKKDVTWKSRTKKDPGIPSSFPYKEQIIVELEEGRKAEQEKRAQLKLQRQQERAEALARGEQVDENMDQDSDDENEGGLGALLESAQRAAKAYDGEDDEENDQDMDQDSDEDIEYDLELEEDDEEDNSELDKSRKAYDKIFKTVVDHADVVLYVLDARDPESTRSRKVEQAVLQNPGKRLILVLNKVDLIPTDVLNQWLNVLKSSFPTVPVKALPGSAGSNTFNKNLTSTMTANSLLQALKSFANKANLKRSIIVGVIGYPNVGKSSIINALTNRHGNNSKACPVGNQAGVTTSMREVKIDNKLKILDSPGIVFPDEIINTKKASKAQQEAKLALLSAIPPKQIIDPMPPVQMLLKKLSKDTAMADSLKSYYQLPPLPSNDLNEFTKQFLIFVARTRGRLGKGGVPNLESAALSVLNDWRDGRIVGWTLPKASRSTSGADVVDETTIDGPKSSLRGDKEPPKQEQTTIVSTWAKEFDLDGLLGDNFGLGSN